MKKLYKYELHFSDSAVAYDKGVVELTSDELDDAIDNPDWSWIERDEGRDYADDDYDIEVTCKYFRAPDGVEMTSEELLNTSSDDLVEVAWVSDWLSNIFDD